MVVEFLHAASKAEAESARCCHEWGRLADGILCKNGMSSKRGANIHRHRMHVTFVCVHVVHRSRYVTSVGGVE
jgi:hypothetical protein